MFLPVLRWHNHTRHENHLLSTSREQRTVLPRNLIRCPDVKSSLVKSLPTLVPAFSSRSIHTAVSFVSGASSFTVTPSPSRVFTSLYLRPISFVSQTVGAPLGGIVSSVPSWFRCARSSPRHDQESDGLPRFGDRHW